MSPLPHHLWKRIEHFDTEVLADNRKQLHQAIQNVAAVGRLFLPESEKDEEALLVWIPELSRIAGKWIQGEIKFRSSISPESFTVHLVDASLTTLSSLELTDKKQGAVMIWLEEQLALLQLDISNISLTLPYKLPEYPQAKGKPFKPDSEAQQILTTIFHNSWLAITQTVNTLGIHFDPVIKPHHFYMVAVDTVKDTGDEETSACVRLGMTPGDEIMDEPYMYVNVFPFPSIEGFAPLHYGEWYEDEWVGAIYKLSDIAKIESASDQHRSVLHFLQEVYQILRATIK
ncbi:MAG: hypothetical protein AAFQ94_13985 [Bacteroidota bacterium]